MEGSPNSSDQSQSQSQSQSPAPTGPTHRVGSGTHTNTTTDTIPGVFAGSLRPVNHLSVTGGSGRIRAVNQSYEGVFRGVSHYTGGPLPAPIFQHVSNSGSDSPVPNGQAGQGAPRRHNTNTVKDVDNMDAEISNETVKAVYDFSPDGRHTEEPRTSSSSSSSAAPETSTALPTTGRTCEESANSQNALSEAERAFSTLEMMDIDTIQRVMGGLDSEAYTVAFNALSKEKQIAFMQSTIMKVVAANLN